MILNLIGLPIVALGIDMTVRIMKTTEFRNYYNSCCDCR